MPTANVFKRTFKIKYKGAIGTGFELDHNGKRYLATAAHVVRNINNGDVISIFQNDKWVDYTVYLSAYGDPDTVESDVAAVVLSDKLLTQFPMPLGGNGLTFGQDVFFVGFPYGLGSTLDPSKTGYSVPLIKKGIVSGMVRGNLDFTYIIDAHANPGFSGSPVVLRVMGENDYRCIGIISQRKSSAVDVTFNGAKTGLNVMENTGIVMCPSIEVLTSIIDKNPIGIDIK